MFASNFDNVEDIPHRFERNRRTIITRESRDASSAGTKHRKAVRASTLGAVMTRPPSHCTRRRRCLAETGSRCTTLMARKVRRTIGLSHWTKIHRVSRSKPPSSRGHGSLGGRGMITKLSMLAISANAWVSASAQAWLEVPQHNWSTMPSSRSCHAAVVYGDVLIIYGGIGVSTTYVDGANSSTNSSAESPTTDLLGDVWELDLAAAYETSTTGNDSSTNEYWRELTPDDFDSDNTSADFRAYTATAIVDDGLLVFGGLTAGAGKGEYNISDALRRFDVNGRAWITLSYDDNEEAPSARYGATGTAYDGDFLVFGGMDENEVFGELWSYSPESLEWTLLDSRDEAVAARHAATSVTASAVNGWKDRLVFYGGISNASPSSATTNGGAYDMVDDAGSASGAGDFYPLSWSPQLARTGHSMVTDEYGRVWVYGGRIAGIDDDDDSNISDRLLVADVTANEDFQDTLTLSSSESEVLVGSSSSLVIGAHSDWREYISSQTSDDSSTAGTYTYSTHSSIDDDASVTSGGSRPGSLTDHVGVSWEGIMVIHGGRLGSGSIDETTCSMWMLEISSIGDDLLQEAEADFSQTNQNELSMMHLGVAIAVLLGCTCLFWVMIRKRHARSEANHFGPVTVANDASPWRFPWYSGNHESPARGRTVTDERRHSQRGLTGDQISHLPILQYPRVSSGQGKDTTPNLKSVLSAWRNGSSKSNISTPGNPMQRAMPPSSLPPDGTAPRLPTEESWRLSGSGPATQISHEGSSRLPSYGSLVTPASSARQVCETSPVEVSTEGSQGDGSTQDGGAEANSRANTYPVSDEERSILDRNGAVTPETLKSATMAGDRSGVSRAGRAPPVAAVSHSPSPEWGQGRTTDETCAICLTEYVAGSYIRVVVPCDHMFHARCVDEWLMSHDICPMCKANVVVDSGNADQEGGVVASASSSSAVRTRASSTHRGTPGGDSEQGRAFGNIPRGTVLAWEGGGTRIYVPRGRGLQTPIVPESLSIRQDRAVSRPSALDSAWRFLFGGVHIEGDGSNQASGSRRGTHARETSGRSVAGSTVSEAELPIPRWLFWRRGRQTHIQRNNAGTGSQSNTAHERVVDHRSRSFRDFENLVRSTVRGDPRARYSNREGHTNRRRERNSPAISNRRQGPRRWALSRIRRESEMRGQTEMVSSASSPRQVVTPSFDPSTTQERRAPRD